MKKTILSAIITSLVVTGAFGQGYVNWSSANPTYVTFNTDSTFYSPFAGSQAGTATGSGSVAATTTTALSYYYELITFTTPSTGAPATLSALNSWSDQTRLGGGVFAANNSSGVAGYVAVTGGTASSQVNWASTVAQSIALVGWSANLGTTFATALGHLNNWATDYATVTGNGATQAFFGVTSAANLTPKINSPGIALFSASEINSPNTPLYLLSGVAPMPEPGTMALAALGGASLLLFRRRK